MKFVILVAMAALVAAQQPSQPRDLAAQISERIFLLQKEFELLVRQFNRIRTGNAFAPALISPEVTPVEPESLQAAVEELDQTRRHLDTLIATVQKNRQGRQQVPDVGGQLPFVGQITQIFSGLGGKSM